MRALVYVAAALAGCVVWSLLCELFALHVLGSTHVVYYLVDRNGAVLYVGSTNDHRRRYREHADPAEPGEWRRSVSNMAVVKHCWTQRQARRVERRMIRALWDGSRWGMCPPIWNVALARPAGFLALPRFLWLCAYRLNGVLWPGCRFHAPNPAGWVVRAGERETNGVTGDVRVAATYGPSRSGPGPGADRPSTAPLGALPAADMSASADTQASPPDGGTVRGPLRAVPNPQDDALPETAEERRRRLWREQKQRQRRNRPTREASSR